jgi:hypothetical protein
MPEFKTKKEWWQAAQKLQREQGLNAAQIKEKIGLFDGWRLDNSKSKGLTAVNLATKLKKDTLRAEKGKVPESTRSLFPDDKSHKTYRQSVNRDTLGVNQRTRQASQDSGITYHKGHIQASAEGGPTSSRGLRLENGSNNSSHGRTSPPRGALLNTGAPVDWNNDAINYLDPSGLPTEYSPKDKQAILNAPADKVDEVTAAVDKKIWDRIKMNPDARPIRTNPNPNISNPPKKQNFHGLTRDAFNQGVPKPPNGRRSAGSARTMRPTSRVPRAEAGFVSMPEVKLPNKKQLLSIASHFVPGPSKQAITALSSGPVQEDTRSTGLKLADTLTSGLEPIKSLVRQANPQLDEEKDLQQTSNEVQKFLKNPLNELKWGLKILQSGM